MENQPKKSKALIITIVLILLIVLLGYLIFKNKDIFGVKTSTTISKIFAPLITSDNSKNLNKIDAQAGENLKKGDSVSVFGTGANNNPIVVKSSTNGGDIYGYADQDIESGDMGTIVLNNTKPNDFWNSFSDFVDNMFGSNPDLNPNTGDQCTNGADNFPECTTIGGNCQNGATNPPLCTLNGTECTNGTNNFPLCTTIDGQCQNGAINPPLCNDAGDNVCENGADNFPQCTTLGGNCMNGASNPPSCTENPNVTGSDLVAGNVSPLTATINTPTTLSSIITNTGGTSTDHSFSNFFSIKEIGGVGLSSTIELNVTIPTLGAMVSDVATVSYTFKRIGMYSIRACADKSSSADKGTVRESNEDNNCGDYITLTVSSSLPSPDTRPQCNDTLDNDGDGKIDINDPNCHIDDGSLTGGAYMPDHDSESTYPTDPDAGTPECNDKIDNDEDGLTDINDPVCHTDEDITKPYLPNHSTESSTAPNICLDIDLNPLIFTEQEKAELATLLRKFYLLAPTLKTQDDVDVAYTEIAQYKNFSDYLGVLTNQCYEQSVSKDGTIVNPSYTGPTLRYGNPWYKYSTSRGSYIKKDANENFVGLDCKFVSGWFTGRAVSGVDCESYTRNIYNPSLGGKAASCFSPLITADLLAQNPDAETEDIANTYQQEQYTYAKDTEKCVWHNGVDISNLETILNVW